MGEKKLLGDDPPPVLGSVILRHGLFSRFKWFLAGTVVATIVLLKKSMSLPKCCDIL